MCICFYVGFIWHNKWSSKLIEIYGKPDCVNCNMAKMFCEKHNYDYSYKSLGTDFDRAEMLMHFPNARSYPQIKIDGESIGGYTELTTWAPLL